jgi:hypothetical protein
MSVVARKTGMKAKDFNNIFNQLMPEKRDGLWLDMTDKSPAPIRKNGYTIINKGENNIN